MARYVTTIESRLSPAEALAYLADFANARVWDTSVSQARKVGEGEIAVGSEFDRVPRIAGRDVALRYRIMVLEPPERAVLEARRPGFVSRDEITVEAAADGSIVHYDAALTFNGLGRALDPLMQLAFRRVGAKAAVGLQGALNP